MNTSSFQGLSFKDKYLGDYGFFIWVIPVASLSFFMLSIFCLFVSVSMNFEGANEYLVLIIGNLFFTISTIWFLYELYIARVIIQDFQLFNKKIYIITYFRRKINLSVNEISSITKLDKNSFLLKKHRAVQTEEPCLQIITKDNKRYLITPHMERFDELKAKLTEIVEQNKKTN